MENEEKIKSKPSIKILKIFLIIILTILILYVMISLYKFSIIISFKNKVSKLDNLNNYYVKTTYYDETDSKISNKIEIEEFVYNNYWKKIIYSNDDITTIYGNNDTKKSYSIYNNNTTSLDNDHINYNLSSYISAPIDTTNNFINLLVSFHPFYIVSKENGNYYFKYEDFTEIYDSNYGYAVERIANYENGKSKHISLYEVKIGVVKAEDVYKSEIE